MITLSIPFALLFLFYFGIQTIMVVCNYVFWLRFQDVYFTQQFRDFYLAFAIIGMVAFAAVGGPCFSMAYKYSATQTSKRRKLLLGVTTMWLTSSTPLTVGMCINIIVENTLMNAYNGVVFILVLISWYGGIFYVWFGYMGLMSGFLHRQSGLRREVVFSQIAQGSERVPPPMSIAKPVRGQPAIV